MKDKAIELYEKLFDLLDEYGGELNMIDFLGVLECAKQKLSFNTFHDNAFKQPIKPLKFLKLKGQEIDKK